MLHCLLLYKHLPSRSNGAQIVITEWANSLDPDQIAHQEQFDHGLHYLLDRVISETITVNSVLMYAFVSSSEIGEYEYAFEQRWHGDV